MNEKDQVLKHTKHVLPFKSKKIQNSNECNIKYKNEEIPISCNLKDQDFHHHAKLGEYAVCLWKEKLLTDIVIVVQSQEFKAHKAVLACYSPYFKEMLAKPGLNDFIYLQLPSVTAKAFEILLEYMYTGKIHVTCQDLSEVYRAARKLGIAGALKQCIELLHVTPRNFQNMVYLYVTAQKLNLLDSSKRAFNLMVDNFEKLVETKEFLDLEKNHILELLSVDEIGARREVVLFLAALKWINHRYLEREENIIEILECIRFPLMNMEELVACYHPPLLPGIINIPHVKQLLLNATCYAAAKSIGKHLLFQELAAKSRTFLDEEESSLLWDTSLFTESKFIEMKEQRAAKKIQAYFRGYLTRKYFRKYLAKANSAATVIQSFYRGYKVRKDLKHCLEMIQKPQLSHEDLKGIQLLEPFPISDIIRKKSENQHILKNIKKSSERKLNSINCLLLGTCYSSGSEIGQNSIFSFNIEKNEWEFITKCPLLLNGAKIAATSEALYVIGGWCPLDQTDTEFAGTLMDCHKYQFEDRKWSILPSMNHSRRMHCVVQYQNNILAIGGKDDDENIRVLSSVEIFRESLNKWLEIHPSLPIPLAAMGCTVQSSNLWVAGGFTQMNGKFVLSDEVWCFNIDSKSWEKHSNLPQPMSFNTLLAREDSIISIGGIVHSHIDGELISSNVVYSLESGKWAVKKSMPEAYHNINAYINGRNIYVFGGMSTKTMSHLRQPFYFESEKDEWLPFTQLPGDCQFIEALTPYDTDF